MGFVLLALCRRDERENEWWEYGVYYRLGIVNTLKEYGLDLAQPRGVVGVEKYGRDFYLGYRSFDADGARSWDIWRNIVVEAVLSLEWPGFGVDSWLLGRWVWCCLHSQY